MRKSCSCTLSAVALVLVAHANITGISKMGFANMSSKLMSTHGNQVRGHGKSERATALEGVSNVLPAPRAEILQKQANRPHVQELFLCWGAWALLTVLGAGATSLAFNAYHFGIAGAWSHFLADPTCGGLMFAIPVAVLCGTLRQGFQVWRWSLAGGLGVAAAKAFGARDPAMDLKERVAALGARAGLPSGCPRVFVVPTPEPNAFAAGHTPDDSVVAVTTGLLNTTNLSSDELDAVLAHEIGHISNGDCASGKQIAVMVAGFSSLLSIGVYLMDSTSRSSKNDKKDNSATFAVAIIFAGALLYSLGYLLQSWHSRRREFVADEAAVALTGTGALAGALAKIEQASWATQSGRALAEEKPEFSHLYISSHSDRNSGFFGLVSNLLRSHPQTYEREEAIRQTLQKVGLTVDQLPETRSTV